MGSDPGTTRSSVDTAEPGSKRNGAKFLPSITARARGEAVANFLKAREVLWAGDVVEYLRLRKVERFRVSLLSSGGMLIELPRERMEVIASVAGWRPREAQWIVLELPWWRRGRKEIRGVVNSIVLG